MTKGDNKSDPIERARRKLAKAQLALNAAQERHAEARVRGKQEVERARLRAAKWQAKAAEKVERRAEKVARAEAKLLALTSNVEVEQLPAQGLSSPDGVAERLEVIEEQLNEANTSPIVVLEGSEPPSVSEGGTAGDSSA